MRSSVRGRRRFFALLLLAAPLLRLLDRRVLLGIRGSRGRRLQRGEASTASNSSGRRLERERQSTAPSSGAAWVASTALPPESRGRDRVGFAASSDDHPHGVPAQRHCRERARGEEQHHPGAEPAEPGAPVVGDECRPRDLPAATRHPARERSTASPPRSAAGPRLRRGRSSTSGPSQTRAGRTGAARVPPARPG